MLAQCSLLSATKIYAITPKALANGAELSRGQTVSCGCWHEEAMEKYRRENQVDGTCLHLLNNTPTKANTSGVKGVYCNKRAGMWWASIQFKKKRYSLGYHTLTAAAEARREAEEMIFNPYLESKKFELTDESEYQKNLYEAVHGKLYTIEDAADYIGKSVRTMGEYARGGTISAVKRGRRWMFPQDVLDAYLKKVSDQKYHTTR